MTIRFDSDYPTQYIEIIDGDLKGARGYFYSHKSKNYLRLFKDGLEIVKLYENERYTQIKRAVAKQIIENE